jgi:hypothetical protein
MKPKIRKSASFSLSAKGDLSYFDPISQRETRLSPELVEILCCIGRGDDLGVWADGRNVSRSRVDVCLEILAKIHLIADEEEESDVPAGTARQDMPAFVISTMRDPWHRRYPLQRFRTVNKMNAS